MSRLFSKEIQVQLGSGLDIVRNWVALC